MANWYEKLKEIDGRDPLEMIHVRENRWTSAEGESKKVAKGSLENCKELLDYEFDDGYGGSKGPYFTAWSAERIYFPVTYDGSEWIEWVWRHPSETDNRATVHVGGE